MPTSKAVENVQGLSEITHVKCLRTEPDSKLYALDVSLLLLLLLSLLQGVLCTSLGLCFSVFPDGVIGFWRGSRNCLNSG